MKKTPLKEKIKIVKGLRLKAARAIAFGAIPKGELGTVTKVIAKSGKSAAVVLFDCDINRHKGDPTFTIPFEKINSTFVVPTKTAK